MSVLQMIAAFDIVRLRTLMRESRDVDIEDINNAGESYSAHVTEWKGFPSARRKGEVFVNYVTGCDDFTHEKRQLTSVCFFDDEIKFICLTL